MFRASVRFFLFICAASQAYGATDYEIRPGTLIGFSYMVAGVPFYGTFVIKQSKFSIDFKNPENSTLALEFDTTKSTAGFYLATKAMLGGTILDSRNHPTINFFSTDIGLADGQFLLVGMATIKGITDRIEITVSLGKKIEPYRKAPQEISFLFNASFSREKFRANGFSKLVGDTIELRDEVILYLKKD